MAEALAQILHKYTAPGEDTCHQLKSVPPRKLPLTVQSAWACAYDQISPTASSALRHTRVGLPSLSRALSNARSFLMTAMSPQCATGSFRTRPPCSFARCLCATPAIEVCQEPAFITVSGEQSYSRLDVRYLSQHCVSSLSSVLRMD